MRIFCVREECLGDVRFAEGYGPKVLEDFDDDGGVWGGIVEPLGVAVRRVHPLNVEVIFDADRNPVKRTLDFRQTVKLLCPFLRQSQRLFYYKVNVSFRMAFPLKSEPIKGF